MCVCTPNIRTPFCGRLPCVWPEKKVAGLSHEEINAIGRREVEKENRERRRDAFDAYWWQPPAHRRQHLQ
jgi:hypothetical protein